MRFVYILLLLISVHSSAQISLGVFVEPSAQLTSISKYSSSEYDSLKALLHRDMGISLGLEIGIAKDKYNSFHIKPGYYQYGFLLVRENLQLFDIVHPGLDTIYDQSQAANKMAYMHHRFKYAGLQMEYHRDISPRTKNLGVKFHIGGGLSYYYLLKHDIRIRTEGFAFDEKFKHTVDSDLFFTANKHLLSVHALFETIYEPKPTVEVFAQFLIKAPLMTLTKKDPAVYSFMPALNLGIRKTL